MIDVFELDLPSQEVGDLVERIDRNSITDASGRTLFLGRINVPNTNIPGQRFLTVDVPEGMEYRNLTTQPVRVEGNRIYADQISGALEIFLRQRKIGFRKYERVEGKLDDKDLQVNLDASPNMVYHGYSK